MSVQFAVLASGSRGNSTLIRDRVAGLLIDAGMGPKELGQRLENVGSNWSQIASVVLTHTHGDHVDSATFSELARRGAILYCHEGHREELATKAGFQKLEDAGLIRFFDERPFMTTTGLRLEPIPLRHDGGPTFGFRIEVSAERRGRSVSIGYLADTGTWSEAMADCLVDVEVLGVEFNHDLAMQKSSGRPRFLIARNLGDTGHLSNGQGADLVQAVLSRSRKNSLRHLVLLHLSEQCNQPDLAIQAAREAIRSGRHDPQIHAARQSPAHPNLWIHPRSPGARPTGFQAARPRPPRRRKESADVRTLPGFPCLIPPEGDRDPD
jgi:phosphoribosyl 1,2-cyclic phosphodiesterase